MANASGALSGAASGAAAGSMIMPGVGTAVGAVLGGLSGLFSKKADSKVEYKPLDIAKVISDARTSAAENIKNSISLENQFRPGTAALRTTTDTAMGNLAAGTTPGFQARDSLLTGIANPTVDSSVSTNPLLQESSSRIMANLRLGGALGPDAQAQAMKAALEKGGAAGISGSGAARGLVARDLGLTSLGLENQRIGAAQDAGKTQATLALSGQQLSLQDLIARAGIAGNAAGLDTQRTGLLGSLIDARALPESGLNPGAIASLYVADNNAANQVNTTNAAIQQQQRNQNLNSLLGLGSLAASSGTNVAGTLQKLFARPDTSGDFGGEL